MYKPEACSNPISVQFEDKGTTFETFDTLDTNTGTLHASDNVSGLDSGLGIELDSESDTDVEYNTMGTSTVADTATGSNSSRDT
jgi:hypothetical protein